MTTFQLENPPGTPVKWNPAEALFAMLKVWNDCCPDTALADLANLDEQQFHGYCNAVRTYPGAENLLDWMIRALLEKFQNG